MLITTRMSDNAGDNSILVRFRGCLSICAKLQILSEKRSSVKKKIT